MTMMLQMLKNYFYSKDLVILQLIYFLGKMNFSAVDSLLAPKIIEVACIMRNTSEAFRCGHLNMFPDLADEIQDDASIYLMAYYSLINAPAAIFGIGFGAWIDRNGRKLPMAISALGAIIAMIIFILSETVFGYTMVFLLCGAAVLGVCGKTSVLNIAVNSYVANNVEDQKRTTLLTNVTAVSYIGSFCGSVLAGFFQREITLFASYIILMLMIAVSCFTTCVFVPRKSVPAATTETKQPRIKTSSLVKKKVKDVLFILFKKKLTSRKYMILVFMLIPVMNLLSNIGYMNLLLLYVTKAPLSWEDFMYSFSKGAFYLALGFASLIILPVLIKVIKVSDPVILLIGTISKIIGLIALALSRTTWLVYMSIAIYSCSCFIFTAVKAILSKELDQGDSGKLFAAIAAVDTLTKAPGNMFALFLYSKTEDIYHGLVFFIEAGLCIPVVVLVIIILYSHSVQPQVISTEPLASTVGDLPI